MVHLCNNNSYLIPGTCDMAILLFKTKYSSIKQGNNFVNEARFFLLLGTTSRFWFH